MFYLHVPVFLPAYSLVLIQIFVKYNHPLLHRHVKKSREMEFEIIKTQTNMGKKCIIVDSFTIRKDSVLKCGDISWICTLNNNVLPDNYP